MFTRYEKLLESVSFLNSLNRYERHKIADALFTREYVDGNVILKQGEHADCMYFVESGEVKICMKKNPDKPEVEISRKKVFMYSFISTIPVFSYAVYSVQ